MKLVQVKRFYYFTLLCHLAFSVVLSVYCGVFFNRVCRPGILDNPEERWNPWTTIACEVEPKNFLARKVIIASWIFLIASLVIYTMKESVKMATNPLLYFRCATGRIYKTLDSYRNIAIIILTILAVSQGPLLMGAERLDVPRWSYYAASCACFTTWWEMMYMVGKIPKFGKYVHMFR